MNTLFDFDSNFVYENESVYVKYPITKSVFAKPGCDMFNLFMTKTFTSTPKIPLGFEKMIRAVYEFHNTKDKQNLEKEITYKITDPIKLTPNNNVIVGFSGGLDSCYLALKLKNDGYNVTLFHVNNLNTYAQPNEDNFAREYAKEGGFKYVEVEHKRLKSNVYSENPIRNQFVMMLMLDYALENNITKIAMGADWTEPLSECVVGLDATDSIEINKYFWDGVKYYIDGIELIFCEDNIKKVDRVQYIKDKNFNLFELVYSCVVPYRYSKSLKENNETKYGIKLLNGRCGSCVKCCREFLYLTHLGYYDKNDKNVQNFIEHCWLILSDSKYALMPQKYNKKIPIEIRWKNLLEQGS